jgi:uncharacterized protein (TIGR00290 family)
LQISPQRLDELRRTYADCLCPTCLAAIAREDAANTTTKTPVLLSWSGGKDCALALYELQRGSEFEVVALLTTISQEHRRISHHGVRETLLDAQAEAIGLPLVKVYLPANDARPCTNEVYERLLGAALAPWRAKGIEVVAFGDLFLEDLRAWREQSLAKLGMRGDFPLWQRDTTALAREMIGLRFKAYLSCVDERVGAGFVGRLFDESLLRDLPAGVDPCGERGEFHTFVFDGPIFRRPVAVEVGAVVARDQRYYADLVPTGADVVSCAAGDIPPVS